MRKKPRGVVGGERGVVTREEGTDGKWLPKIKFCQMLAFLVPEKTGVHLKLSDNIQPS